MWKVTNKASRNLRVWYIIYYRLVKIPLSLHFLWNKYKIFPFKVDKCELSEMVKIRALAAWCCSHVCGQQRGNRTGQREEFLCLSAAAGLLFCCYRPGTGPLANTLSPTIPDLMDVNDEGVVGAQLRVQDARLWSWGRPCSLAHAHQSWRTGIRQGLWL